MSLSLTVQDLPAIANQLDTIAEHDLQEQSFEDPAIAEDMATARTLIRDARVLLLQAAVLLGEDEDA